jgi:putative membrane protein
MDMKMMLAAAVALTLAANVTTAEANPLDVHWLKANAQANVAEIGAAKWMLGETANAQVQALARQLIRDHTKALAADKKVARSIHVKLVLAPPPDAAWDMRELQKEVALGNVDKAYALLEVADHKMNIQATKEEIAGGDVSPVLALARATLPVLQTHLTMAKRTLAQVS